MEIAKQLAVFLDNEPGALARVCEAFAEKGINTCLTQMRICETQKFFEQETAHQQNPYVVGQLSVSVGNYPNLAGID